MQNWLDRLPQEILENIYDNLPNPDLGRLSLTSGFFRNSVSAYQVSRPEYINYNLRNGYCDKRIILPEHNEKRSEFASGWHKIFIINNLVITVNAHAISVIEMVTGKLLWNMRLDHSSICTNKVWINQNRIIYASYPNNLGSGHTKAITSVDLVTGKVLSMIQDPLLQLGSVNVIENQLISKLNNGTIKFWNAAKFKLEEIQEAIIKDYHMDVCGNDYSNLIVTKDYIIDHICNFYTDIVTIYMVNRHSGQQTIVEREGYISNIILYKNNFLICNSSFQAHPHLPELFMVDIQKGKIIKTWSRIRDDLVFYGSVRSIVASDTRIFTRHDGRYEGGVCCADINGTTLLPIRQKGDKNNHHLFLSDQHLFIPNKHAKKSCFESVDIWDLRSMTHLARLTDIEMLAMTYNNGCIIMSCHTVGLAPAICMYDYKVSHQIRQREDMEVDNLNQPAHKTK